MKLKSMKRHYRRLIFKVGITDCKKGKQPKVNNESYLEGYGRQYEREARQS